MSQAAKDIFTKFSEAYDNYRPESPVAVLHDIIQLYYPKKPLDTLVDVGCGTGLSTVLWTNYANQVIGIERNRAMLDIAQSKVSANGANLRFLAGDSEHIPLPDTLADIITCSQAFHWMMPQETLAEFVRLLKPNGMVAIYDCDWPPSIGQYLEGLSNQLITLAKEILKRDQVEINPADKSQHLVQLQNSALFSFCKEICFHTTTQMSAEQFIGVIQCRAWLQHAINTGDQHIIEQFEYAKTAVREYMEHRSYPAIMTYRLRMAIK